MSWNVCWDGHRGPITTKWGVDHFPTVYVIDRDGKVADSELRGAELKQKVVELIAK